MPVTVPPASGSLVLSVDEGKPVRLLPSPKKAVAVTLANVGESVVFNCKSSKTSEVVKDSKVVWLLVPVVPTKYSDISTNYTFCYTISPQMQKKNLPQR